MELHDALTQVSEIRQQLERSRTFRGFRARPAAFSALAALAAATVQPLVVQDPAANPAAFVGVWVTAAAVCLAVTLADLLRNVWHAPSLLATRLTVQALEQLLPSVVAGGLLTLVIVLHAQEAAWMLPGLWAVVFSLGVFASGRLLPRPILAVGAWYLACGVLSLAWFQGERAFSPWAMAVPFGVGQLLTAGLLYCTLERRHERVES